jgi:hypothetical protein
VIRTTLADLTGRNVEAGRWVRLPGNEEGNVGRLTSVHHDRGTTHILLELPDGGEVSTCIVGPDSVIHLLYGCEVCDDPIVDEEPHWIGEDGDQSVHRECGVMVREGAAS